jgi:outer membrane protein
VVLEAVRQAGKVILNRPGALALAAILLGAWPNVASAQTLTDALSAAYMNNPTLNAARATLRAVDEGVPQALSNYRPQINGNLSAGAVGTGGEFAKPRRNAAGKKVRRTGSGTYPLSIGVDLVQPIFRGFQTQNSVRSAESSVLAEREALRNSEQGVMFDAVTSFVDVIQNLALVRLQEANLQFLTEQVKASQDRFQVGEGTQTDVAQAQASQAQAEADLASARADVQTARAQFRAITGLEAKKLVLQPVGDKVRPKGLDGALASAQTEHPAILATIHNVDVAMFNVKALEGQTLPQVDLQAGLSRDYTYGGVSAGQTRYQDTASVQLNMTVPIYQGGLPSSQVRQAKEDLGNARIQVDLNRDTVRAQVVSAWYELEAAEAAIISARTAVVANQLAVNGVVEEQRVGQATTLDVLQQQSLLIDAQTTLVFAERNKVVALYALIQSVGRLNAEALKLPVPIYRPRQHYEAVRDEWFGLRTPDGR